MTDVNILLADDHELVRDALAVLLQRDFDNPVIDLASSYNEIQELLIKGKTYNLIITDLVMPGMTGLECIQDILNLSANTPLAVMSGHINKNDIQALYDLGIQGYIPKTITGKALSNILRLIMSGERYVSEIYLNSSESLHIVPNTGAKLTSREYEVLGGLLKGLSNKQIAALLFIEETTVKLHLRTLFEKLEAKNRTDAVIKAMKFGFGNSLM